MRALRGAEVLVAVMLTRSCRNLTRAPAAAFPAACFFLEQGTLDYITRLEESTAAASASCCREHEAVDVHIHAKEIQEHSADPEASLDDHVHTHLSLVDAAAEAHARTHIHVCGADDCNTALIHVHSPSRQLALCYSLEMSIVVHSIIIGCACSAACFRSGCAVRHCRRGRCGGCAAPTQSSAHDADMLRAFRSFELGMNPDTSPLVGLTIVLCFHQFFEGLGMGAYISRMARCASSAVASRCAA